MPSKTFSRLRTLHPVALLLPAPLRATRTSLNHGHSLLPPSPPMAGLMLKRLVSPLPNQLPLSVMALSASKSKTLMSLPVLSSPSLLARKVQVLPGALLPFATPRSGLTLMLAMVLTNHGAETPGLTPTARAPLLPRAASSDGLPTPSPTRLLSSRLRRMMSSTLSSTRSGVRHQSTTMPPTLLLPTSALSQTNSATYLPVLAQLPTNAPLLTTSGALAHSL